MNREVTKYLQTYSTSRRQFVRASAIAGGITAAAHFTPAAVAGLALGRAAAIEGGDLGVLNYALTLEHLENNLYATLIGSDLLSGDALAAAKQFGGEEAEHVDLLTKAISGAGGTPVEEEEYSFPELSSQDEVLDTLVMVEDLGASAYLGAAPLIESGDILTVAVQIHSVEAYHATGIRFLAGENTVPFAFAEPTSPEDVITQVTPFFMDGMPGTGGGGLSRGGSGSAQALGVAGLSAAAFMAMTRLRNRRAAEESKS